MKRFVLENEVINVTRVDCEVTIEVGDLKLILSIEQARSLAHRVYELVGDGVSVVRRDSPGYQRDD